VSFSGKAQNDLQFWADVTDEEFFKWLGKGKARWLSQKAALEKFMSVYFAIYLHFVGVRDKPTDNAQRELADFVVRNMVRLEIYLTAAAITDLMVYTWPSKLILETEKITPPLACLLEHTFRIPSC